MAPGGAKPPLPAFLDRFRTDGEIVAPIAAVRNLGIGWDGMIVGRAEYFSRISRSCQTIGATTDNGSFFSKQTSSTTSENSSPS